MNPAIDIVLRHALEHAVPVLHPHRVDMVGVNVSVGNRRTDHPRFIGKQLVVKRGVLAAGFVRRGQAAQFKAEDRGLDAVHPGVPADGRMQIFRGLAVVAQNLDF